MFENESCVDSHTFAAEWFEQRQIDKELAHKRTEEEHNKELDEITGKQLQKLSEASKVEKKSATVLIILLQPILVLSTDITFM